MSTTGSDHLLKICADLKVNTVSELKDTLIGLINECKSETPLHALIKLRGLIHCDDDSSRRYLTQLLLSTGLGSILIKLMQTNPHNFAMLLGAYTRESKLPDQIPQDIVACIAEWVEIIPLIDERLQVESRVILCNLVAGMYF